jgi:hypothetical protein
VLIADADADTRALYHGVLRGCDIVEAEDGRDALVKSPVAPTEIGHH